MSDHRVRRSEELELRINRRKTGEWQCSSLVRPYPSGVWAVWHRDRFEGLYAALAWTGGEAFLHSTELGLPLTYVSALDPPDLPDLHQAPLPF